VDVTVRDDIDPRIERSRDCILTATIDLLREVGYGSLTIEAVAARSGVAKSTIYRHWPGKAQLVADAFARAHEPPGTPPPGPVRDRVVALLSDLAAAVVEPDQRLACMLPALIDAAERSDDIAALACRLAEASERAMIQVLEDAVRSGELPPETDIHVLCDALHGTVLLSRLLHRPFVEPDAVPAMVDQVLPPVRTASTSTSASADAS
jgi:AcrR family transcriptional regulator